MRRGAALVSDIYRSMRSRFVDVARRAQAAGQVPAGADPADLGAVLFGLVPAYIMQRLLLGDVSPRSYQSGLRALVRSGSPAPLGHGAR